MRPSLISPISLNHTGILAGDNNESSGIKELFWSKMELHVPQLYHSIKKGRPTGATENAKHENARPSKMQVVKMRDMKMWHQSARVENARHDKVGKANTRHENNASKAVMRSQMYKFGSLRQLCVKNSDNEYGVARWLSGRASDLRFSSRGFEARPRRCCVTTLGKLFTPYCLCHQAV